MYVCIPRCTVARYVCMYVDCMRALGSLHVHGYFSMYQMSVWVHLEETQALLLGNSTNVVNQQTSYLPNNLMCDNC